MSEQEGAEQVLEMMSELVKKGKMHFTCDELGRVQVHLDDGRIFGLGVTGFERIG